MVPRWMVLALTVPAAALSCGGMSHDLCDSADDDGDGFVDEGPEACESPSDGSGIACRSGACTVTTCATGRADCNRVSIDGCEAILTSARTCGGCGTSCGRWERCDRGECRALPTQVGAVGQARATFALNSEGRVMAVGEAPEYLLGGTEALSRWTPVGTTSGSLLDPGLLSVCLLESPRTIACWGWSPLLIEAGIGERSALRRTELPADVRALESGGWHSCALLVDGSVHCWGSNGHQQLSLEPEVDPGRASPVAGLPQLRNLSVGTVHACGVSHGGEVWCWGWNGWGVAGASERATAVVPAAPVAGLPPEFTRVIVDHEKSCAITTAGTVWCWGRVGAALGFDDSDSMPRELVALGSGIVDITLRDGGACALDDIGRVRCLPSDARIELAGLPPLSALGRGNVQHHNIWGPASPYCGVTGDGDVWCWGWNGGFLGDEAPDDVTAAVRVFQAVP